MWSLPIEWDDLERFARAYAYLPHLLSEKPNERRQLIKSVRKDPQMLEEVLLGMHQSLRSVLLSSLPVQTRYATAISLSQRYARELESMRGEPGMPAEAARLAETTMRDFHSVTDSSARSLTHGRSSASTRS